MTLILSGYMQQQGVDAERLARESEVPLDTITKQGQMISDDQEDRIWQNAIRLGNEPHLGMYLGQQFYDLSKGHILLALLANCPTLEDVLVHLERHHSVLHGARAMHIELHQMPDYLACSCTYSGGDKEVSQHIVEAFLSGIQTLLQKLAGFQITAREIHLQHHPRENETAYEHVFGDAVLFGQRRNQIVFDRQLLASPLAMACPDFLKVLIKHATETAASNNEQQSWTQKVSDLLVDADSLTGLTIQETASALAVSSRKLQASLKSEGTSFRLIKDQKRLELARSLLKQHQYSLAEISLSLGFADQASFSKFIKQQTGISPGKLRKS